MQLCLGDKLFKYIIIKRLLKGYTNFQPAGASRVNTHIRPDGRNYKKKPALPQASVVLIYSIAV